jgi:multidrug efflux system membrane fusion protein
VSRLLQKWRQVNPNLRVAVVVLMLTGLWMLSGVFNPAPAPEAQPAQKMVLPVQVTSSTAEKTQRVVELVGRTQPDTLANVVAEIDGRVVRVLVREGAKVKKGSPLIKLDEATLVAAVKKAEASHSAARIVADTSEKLFAEGFRSETDLTKAKAELALAEANLENAQRDLNNTTVRSPINGVVEKVSVDEGDYAKRETEVARVVGVETFVITAEVSQQDRAALQVGQKVFADLATGETVEGVLRFVGLEADSLTKTFPIEVLVKNNKDTIPGGVTAKLPLPAGEVMAHFIPQSAQVLADDGRLGVMLAEVHDGKSIAKFYPIEQLQDTGQGIWVLGLPDQIQLIVRGQSDVVDGSKINVEVQP